MAKAPGVEYMPAAQVEQWKKQRAQFMSDPALPAVRDRFLQERRRLLKMLSDAGVDIALGSDAIQTFSVPGFSLHNEMGAMARSGLTPFQILSSGTTNIARYFGRQKEIGTVAPGQIADLVLLDANPLRDVANFARQTGTMTRGRWHPRDELLASLRIQ
jgi:imidazolonepropionase-like amidohydrolase